MVGNNHCWGAVGPSMSCPGALQGGKTRKNRLPIACGESGQRLSASPGAPRKWPGPLPAAGATWADTQHDDVPLTVFHTVSLWFHVLSLEGEEPNSASLDEGHNGSQLMRDL